MKYLAQSCGVVGHAPLDMRGHGALILTHNP
jgi:hypothetical protein